MAYDKAGMDLVAVGPTKLWIYYTADVLTSSPTGSTTNFNSTDCPGLQAGDVIILAHNTKSKLGLIRLTAISSTLCTFTQNAALA